MQDIIKNRAKVSVEKAIITGSSIKSSIEASEYASKYLVFYIQQQVFILMMLKLVMKIH
jgi:Tat protein secretion system quality control protein TatD with DNase activity